MKAAALLAFDRQSVREIDRDGRLHVSVTNISKANICPYLGKEIPGWQALGLAPDQIYQLLRDPEELALAAASFNNLPILDQHVPVDAWEENNERRDIVIGSTGTDGIFVDPYLQNSAVLWSRSAIDDVQAADVNPNLGRRQWSCAYRYTADMTPGNFLGLPYDGVMRNIIGNHVALVDEGRAGPDVMIGDCSMLKSRKALLLSGALFGLVRPKIAQDAKLDFEPLLSDITADNLSARSGKLAVSVAALVQPHLAADQVLNIEDIVDVIAFAADAKSGKDEMPDDPAEDEDPDAPPAEDEDPDAPPAEDCPPAEDEDPDAGAMDMAAVRTMISSAVTADRRRVAAIRQAEIDVQPFIGTLAIAQDSASKVYRLALDAAGIDLTGVHPSSFKHMVSMLPKPGANSPRIATDRAPSTTDFRERFPTAGTMARA